MRQRSFKEIVQSMSGEEIIRAMIDGLENPRVRVDMNEFVNKKNEVCFGCAATCTVLHIMEADVPSTTAAWDNLSDVADLIGADAQYIKWFEFAIDDLRSGEVEDYNAYAEMLGIAQLPAPISELPPLTNVDYKENLEYYKAYAAGL